jgi:hypothetical protein
MSVTETLNARWDGLVVLTASALLPRATLAAANPRSMKKIGDIAMMSVEFDNNGIKTAGNRFVRRALATAANTLRSSSFTVAAA